jgi:crotonobetainyl-CoA:carnitine CoA-transferase CaiB-like acyl-CoA transferase
MSVLRGVRVLDCSIAMAGPFAAQRLGDLGADVVKIEPIGGEWQRHVAAGGAEGRAVNASFLSLNRNKRSLAVDLKTETGRSIVQRLAARADVFLQNYRVGVADRLGVGYETLARDNPGLVYVSISGYGTSGPYARRPGQDMLLQALTGLTYSVGRAGDPPAPAGLFLADAITAYVAFEGAIAALFHRERTGEGQLVEVNMLDAMVTVQMQELSVFTVGGRQQERGREPRGHVYIQPPYGIFATADGFLALAFPAIEELASLLEVPKLAELADDPFQHADEITRLTREALVGRTTADWLAIFDEHGVWAGPVHGYAELVDDPQVRYNGTFVEYEHPTEGRVRTPGFPIRFARTPSAVERPAPLCGQHSREVLREAGLSDVEIDRAVAERAIVDAADVRHAA